MTAKITFKNQILASQFFWITSIMLFFGVWYFQFEPIVLLGALGFQFVFSFPGWYLHVEYYLKNRGQEVTITSNSVTIKDKNGEKHYSNGEIEKIIFYRPGGGFLSMNSYYYASIILKSGEEIIITRLLTPKVAEFVQNLYGVPFERKIVFFANIG
jgi:hypothetical protein